MSRQQTKGFKGSNAAASGAKYPTVAPPQQPSQQLSQRQEFSHSKNNRNTHQINIKKSNNKIATHRQAIAAASSSAAMANFDDEEDDDNNINHFNNGVGAGFDSMDGLLSYEDAPEPMCVEDEFASMNIGTHSAKSGAKLSSQARKQQSQEYQRTPSADSSNKGGVRRSSNNLTNSGAKNNNNNNNYNSKHSRTNSTSGIGSRTGTDSGGKGKGNGAVQSRDHRESIFEFVEDYEAEKAGTTAKRSKTRTEMDSDVQSVRDLDRWG